MQILIIEDNRRILENLSQALGESGHAPLMAASGREALGKLKEQSDIDLIILDLGLPDIDGIELLPRIKAQAPAASVLILTARDSVDDRVIGLDAGADDYLVKPFALAELSARIRSLERRAKPNLLESIRVEDLVLNPLERSITRAGNALILTPKEFEVMLYLCRNAGRPVSREMLAREVFQITSRDVSFNNIIDVHISNLRKKIDAGFELKLIHTLRGIGYLMGRK